MADNVTRIRDTDVRARITVLETQMLHVDKNMETLERRVEDQYNKLHSRISDMRDDLHKEIDDKHTAMMKKLEEHMATESEHHESVREQLASVERWKWMMMGGAIVIGYVLAHLKLDKLF